MSGAHQTFHPTGTAGTLNHDIIHYPYCSFANHFEKLNDYAERGAKDLVAKGKTGGVPNDEARRRALELLTALDVQHRARAMPSQLSGGEQQRVAIARGLVNRPPVILADEPTAPLDSQRAMAVIRILNDMAQQLQTAVIVVTHDEKIIPTFKRIYHIRDGVTHEEAGEGRGLG